MKLRDKNNKEICESNGLAFTMLTNVVEEEYSRNKMRATSDIIAKNLIGTLGPYGTSTIVQMRDTHHFATKDGYDLMNRMSFDDEVSRTILELFRTTASNQVLSVGDGSTSAIVVSNALFQKLTDKEQLHHFRKVAPKDIMDMLNDISMILERELKKMATPISEDMSELDIIAAVANNNDNDAGKLIGDIYRKIGKYGFISMDVLDRQEKDSYELKSGIEWDRGYIDPLFAKGCENDKVVYEAMPRIIISNSTITYDDLEVVMMPLMKEALNQKDSELVIIANDFDEDARNFFKMNRTKHMAPGSRNTEMLFTPVDIDQVTKISRNKLEDLAKLCGCEIYDKFLVKPGHVLANPKKYVGRAAKAIITAKTTQIIALEKENLSAESVKVIENDIADYTKRLNKLGQLEETSKAEDEEIYELRRRIANLTSSSAVLHVGGRTLTERMTRQRLIEDAIFACKSALEYGYIPGGNICIPKILKEKKSGIVETLAFKYDYLPLEDRKSFFEYFVDVLTDAFLESYRNVLNNSYLDEEEVATTISKCLNENKFYNLKTHKFEDFNKTVVINSVDTDLQILRSCISLIGILSTSNQFITLNFDVNGQIRK